jgi:hypothetical protein
VLAYIYSSIVSLFQASWGKARAPTQSESIDVSLLLLQYPPPFLFVVSLFAMIAKFVLRFVSFRFSYLTSKFFYAVVETFTPVLEAEIGAMVATLTL